MKIQSYVQVKFTLKGGGVFNMKRGINEVPAAETKMLQQTDYYKALKKVGQVIEIKEEKFGADMTSVEGKTTENKAFTPPPTTESKKI